MNFTAKDIKALRAASQELSDLDIPEAVAWEEVRTESGAKVFVDSAGTIADARGKKISDLRSAKQRSGWLTRALFGESVEVSEDSSGLLSDNHDLLEEDERICESWTLELD